MRKNFLLLLWLTLLPLAGWAQPAGVKTAPKLASTPITWDGNPHQLIATAGVPADDYKTYAGGNFRQYSAGWIEWGNYYSLDPSGFQYYVGPTSPANGYVGSGANSSNRNRPASRLGGGIVDNVASVVATDPGTYKVWYRIMKDHQGTSTSDGNYQTSNWQELGDVTIEVPALADMPYFLNGPARIEGLVYNDADQALISTANTEFCTGYDQNGGGVLYVVKNTHAAPTAAEEAAATSTIPTGKDAGTYYVYYKILKDGGIYYVNDSKWTEVGIGGITIDKRDIKPEDYAITWATEPLTFNNAAQDLVTGFDWTGGIVRGTAINYVVDQTDPPSVSPTTNAQATNAGVHKVQLVITGDANHNDLETEVLKEIEILKATYTVADPTMSDFTYDGTAQGPLSSTNAIVLSLGATDWDYTSGRIEYSLDGTTWTTDPDDAILKGTNAAEYTISYRTVDPTVKVENADFEKVEGTYTFKIAKADINITNTPELAILPYNAADQELIVTAPTFDTVDPTTVTYYIDAEDTPYADPADVKKTDVGKYTIYYTVDAGSNYNNITDKTQLTAGQAEITTIKLHMGTQTLTKVITDVYDFETSTFKLTAADFLNPDDSEFAGGDASKKAAILNALVETDLDITKLKVGGNAVQLKSITDPTANYEAVLLDDPVNATLNIDAIPVVATAPVGKTGLEYNGNEQALVETAATIAPEKGKIVYSLVDEDAQYAEGLDAIVGKNADTYSVFYKVVLSDAADSEERFYEYKDGVQSINVTIDPKPLADGMITLAWDAEKGGAFTGSDKKADVVVTAVDGDPNIIADTDFEESQITFDGDVVTELINAGEYEFTYTGKGNYTGSTTAKIEIGKAVATIADAPVAKNLTYNRAPQTLVTPGTTNDGTVLYSLSNEASATFTADVPEAEFAGDYTVYYMVKADANHTDSEVFGPIDVTIAKADADPVAPVAIKLTYNGKDQALVDPAEFEDGFVKGYFEYSIDGGKTWTAKNTVPEAKNAGVYTVTTKFTPNDNHEGATISNVTAEIKVAPIGYMLGNMTKTWDGISLNDESQKENLDKVFSIITGELFEDDLYDVPFTLSLPEDYLDAGKYQPTMAIATFKDGYPVNYKVNFTGIANIVIEKADIEDADIKNLPEAATDLAYTGEDQDLLAKGGEVETLNTPDYPEIAGLPYGTFVYATAEDGEYTTEIPAGNAAGEYSVWYKVAGDKNHNDTKATEIKVTIANKALKDEFFVLTANAKGTEYLKTDLMPTISTVKDEPITSDDYDVTITDAEGNEVTKLIDAGKYTFTFTATLEGNYSGSAKATFEITKRPAQAVAYNAEKDYDGVDGLNGTKVDFTFTNLIPGDDDAIQMGDAVYFNGEAKNAGTYPMLFNLGAFDSKNYKVIAVENTGAIFTINKAPLTIEWNEDVDLPAFSKAYGAADPALTATAENIDLTGAVAAEEADIIANTVITRDEGEDVGFYGITLSAKQILENKKYVDAHVFDNYEYTFVPVIPKAADVNVFEIVPAEIIVAVAPQSVTYNGTKVTELEISADDLVVTNLVGKEVKGVVFTKVPKAVVTGEAINAGEYELTIEGAEATNYEIKDYFTSTLTIEPVMVNAKFNNKPVAVEGDDAKVIYAKVDWTVEADDDADQATVEAALAKNLFELQFTTGVVDAKGKIATDDGEDALVIAYLGKETPANFEFIEAYGDLNIGGEGVEIALDDSKAIVTKTVEKADVTFTQNRAVPEDVWQACVLPFTVSIEDLSDAFGYAAVDLFDPSRTNAEEVHFSLQVSGSIEAGTPFLFKTNNTTNFTDVIFEDVDVVATETLDPVVKDDDTNIQFIGVFEPTTFYGEKYRYLSKGTWYNAGKFTAEKPVSLKPLRAYLDMEGAAGARIFIEEPDGTVTAIDAVEFNSQAAEGMYNLNGMKVNQGLKGVYIQNGKKVIK